MKPTRFLVGILIAIWVVVLAVPSLNYLLRLQLRSPESVLLSAWPVSLEKAEPWDKTAKRLPENKSVLYMASITPRMDEMKLDVALSELRSGEKSVNAPGSEPFVDSDDSLPADFTPELPSTIEELEKLKEERWRENIRRLDSLRQKFPDDAFLVAAQLQVMRKNLRTDRLGGELSDPRSPKERIGQLSPERRDEKTNFSPADFKKALELCIIGQRLAPQNGYFNYIECFFQMHSWRDEAAFRALEAIAHKAEFDNYSAREMEINLEAHSAALGRPLTFEEKVGAVALMETISGYHRELARIISWASIKARRRGDHAQALRIMTIHARAYKRMRENSQYAIEGMVAVAMERIAWSSAVYDEVSPEGAWEQKDAWRQNKLKAYVTLHGRPELAVEAAQSAADCKAFMNRVRSSVREGNTYGIALGTFALSSWLWALDVALLISLALTAFVFLLMFVVSRMSGVRQRFYLDENASEENPPAPEVWRGMLVVTGLPAFALAFCGLAVGLSLTILWEVGPLLFSERLQELLAGKGLSLLDSEGMFSISSWDLWNWGLQFPLYDIPWRTVLLWTPVLFGALYAVGRATDWQRKVSGAGKRSFISRALVFVLNFGLAVCWFFLVLDVWPEEQAWLEMFALPVALFCVGLILYDKYLLWRTLPRKQVTVRYGLRLLQRSLFTWLVVGSMLYFASLVSSVPARQQADAGFARFLTEGEIPATMIADKP